MADIPLPLDLTPFRAGTIWHCCQGAHAYIVQRAEVADQVEVVQSVRPGGGGSRGAEADLRLVLWRMPSHDSQEAARDLDVWLQCTADAVIEGQAWGVTNVEWQVGPGGGAPPIVLNISLRRVPWKDPTAIDQKMAEVERMRLVEHVRTVHGVELEQSGPERDA